MSEDSTAVATREPAPLVKTDVATMSSSEINRLYKVASALASSGMFSDATQANEAFAKILIGRDLGLSPTQAMMGIHIVEGKPMVAAVTLAGFVQQHDDYDYKITEHTDEVCSIDFYRGDDLLGTSRYSIEDAERAHLIKHDKPKSNWMANPRNMLFARAMSNGVKWFCPEATGGVPVYTEGEILKVENIADGSGGQPAGSPLPDEVEAVLARAKELGHTGLSDRAAAEMSVNGQTQATIDAWVANSNQMLDAMAEPGAEVTATDEIPDAQLVDEDDEDAHDEPSPDEVAKVKELNDKAVKLRDQADQAEADKDTDTAAELRKQADVLRDEVLTITGQTEIEF